MLKIYLYRTINFNKAIAAKFGQSNVIILFQSCLYQTQMTNFLVEDEYQ